MCAAADPTQSGVIWLMVSQAELRASLVGLIDQLKAGLLARLRALVADDTSSPAEALRAAEQARTDLQTALVKVLEQAPHLQAGSRRVQVGLQALEAEAASCVVVIR